MIRMKRMNLLSHRGELNLLVQRAFHFCSSITRRIRFTVHHLHRKIRRSVLMNLWIRIVDVG